MVFLDDMLVRKPGLILNKSAGTSLFVRVCFFKWHEYRVRRMSTRWTRDKRVSHFDTLDSQYSIYNKCRLDVEGFKSEINNEQTVNALIKDCSRNFRMNVGGSSGKPKFLHTEIPG